MLNEQGDALAMLRAPLLYRTPGMDTVTARRDIAYQATPEGDLRMDVYTPNPAGGGAVSHLMEESFRGTMGVPAPR